MDSIELPITIIATFIGSALSIGVTWGLLRGQLKALEVAAKSLDDDRTTQRKELQAVMIRMVKIEADLEDVADLRANAINREWLKGWMNNCTAALNDMKETVRGKVSVASMARVQPPVPRVDPESDPPPQLPPMRAKMPSRQIR